MQNRDPFRFYGSERAYFSGKARAAFRAKRLYFEEILPTADAMREIRRRTGLLFLPTVVTPEDEAWQDTSDIIDALERRFPEPALVPPSPVQRVVSYLVELYADEFMVLPAMHYRWGTPEGKRDARTSFAAASGDPAGSAKFTENPGAPGATPSHTRCTHPSATRSSTPPRIANCGPSRALLPPPSTPARPQGVPSRRPILDLLSNFAACPGYGHGKGTCDSPGVTILEYAGGGKWKQEEDFYSVSERDKAMKDYQAGPSARPGPCEEGDAPRLGQRPRLDEGQRQLRELCSTLIRGCLAKETLLTTPPLRGDRLWMGESRAWRPVSRDGAECCRALACETRSRGPPDAALRGSEQPTSIGLVRCHQDGVTGGNT